MNNEKKNHLFEICNSNSKNTASDEIYKSFNDFIFSTDTKILGKLLHRFYFFNKVKDLPGDIVEIGVFKGSGMATFSKFVDIFSPNSNKKIIGFDIFNSDADLILDKDGEFDKKKMEMIYSRVNQDELSLESVSTKLDNMNLNKKYMLIKGDVEQSIPSFLKENPGMRISLLYMDVDIERPTYNSLKYLWNRILPGGVILFDEYEFHKFSESNGVEKFIKEFNIKYNLKSTHFVSPSAYMYKK